MLTKDVEEPPKFARSLTEKQWHDLKNDSDRATALLGSELEAADQHIFKELKKLANAVQLNEAQSIERRDTIEKQVKWFVLLVISAVVAALALKIIHP